jgi:2-iminobutanoate/2-iminopropanoate deaminase
MPRKVLHTSTGQVHASPIPQGASANGFLFLSAIRGLDPDTQKPYSDVEQQARQVFAVLANTLEAAGASLDDVVQIGVYMKNLQKDRPIFNRVWEEIFGANPPARFAVEVGDIGAEGDGTKFLINAIAALPGA